MTDKELRQQLEAARLNYEMATEETGMTSYGPGWYKRNAYEQWVALAAELKKRGLSP